MPKNIFGDNYHPHDFESYQAALAARHQRDREWEHSYLGQKVSKCHRAVDRLAFEINADSKAFKKSLQKCVENLERFRQQAKAVMPPIKISLNDAVVFQVGDAHIVGRVCMVDHEGVGYVRYRHQHCTYATSSTHDFKIVGNYHRGWFGWFIKPNE